MAHRTLGLLGLLMLGVVCALPVVPSWPAERVSRIGFLAFGPPPPDPEPSAFPLTAFRHGLHELGYRKGHTVILEECWAAGDLDRLPALVAELVQLPVDVIVASGASAVRAAMGATTVPTTTRVAVVLDSTSRVDSTPLREAARTLGLTVLWSAETATPDEFQSAFAAMSRHGTDALYAPETPVDAQHWLPAMYASRDFVEAGGLMAYGPSFAVLFRRAATYVDKILKGVPPAELPVEQPIYFELVINLKAAQALGLTLPPTLLFQADEIIR